SYQNFLKPEWNIYKIIALTPVNIFFNPGMAINFFFLLSGFVQSFQYFQKPELQTLQKSFIKRYFRLIIPTLAVVILIFVFHKLNFFHKGYLPKNDLTQVWIDSQLPDKFTFLNVLKYTFVDLVNGNSSYYQVL